VRQSGLFEWQNRFDQLDKGGDPLVKLNKVVNWEVFRPELEALREKERKSNAGRKPFDVILMLKVLIIQSLYNLSDDQTEYQVRDRLSFMRFMGLSLSDTIPDAKTIWLFREALAGAGLIERIFERFDTVLCDSGFAARKGQIVDASIVQAPRQRNSRDDNRRIKEGGIPEDWSEQKKRQKDVDARWTKKNGQNHYGYKNHLGIDVKHKLIRTWEVTPASTHDSNVFEKLLDENNSSRDVWADAAYRSEEKLTELKRRGFREHIQRKGCRHKKLTAWEQKGNYSRSKIRSRVEHVFGIQSKRAGTLVIRTIGLVRARAKIGLRNLAYNIDRYSMLMQT